MVSWNRSMDRFMVPEDKGEVRKLDALRLDRGYAPGSYLLNHPWSQVMLRFRNV